MNEATALPEGRELELAAADPAHELDGEERSRLHAMLEQSWARAKAGRMVPIEEDRRQGQGSVIRVR